MQELALERIDTPDDVDDEATFCHLADESDPTQSACGSGMRHHHGRRISYEAEMTHCPGCGREVCPTCAHVFDTFNRTGCWEGV